MNERFFLDTNIFVYSFDHTAKAKAKRAEELIGRALATQKGLVSFQVVQEFFNVALRRFASPMSAFEAEQFLVTVFRSLLAVHSSDTLYAEALRLQSSASLSWCDALIVAAAFQARCDLLFTEGLQHGRKFGTLRILNPFV